MGVEHLTPWKPGQSGNPGGNPKLPDALRAIKSLSVKEVNKLISKYARLSMVQLKAAQEDKKVSVIELCIAAIFARCMEYGDYTRLNFLLERAIGKVPIAVEDDEDRAARKDIEELSDQELLRLAKEKIPELKTA